MVIYPVNSCNHVLKCFQSQFISTAILFLDALFYYYFITRSSYVVRLWDFLEALEEERTGGEFSIIVWTDSDSDSN